MPHAVIVDAIRSPVGRGKPGGALADVHPAELLAQLLTALVERNRLDPGMVDDVITGCVSQVGEQAGTPGRVAWLAAGYPEHVPSTTIDRKCGSSQQAVHFAAQGVMAGAYDIVIACGVESMSRVPMGSSRIGQDPFGPLMTARYAPGLVSQGVSADLVAARWGLSRTALDRYAAQSHRRAHAAREAGAFDREIVPIRTPAGAVARDETIRPDTSEEGLAALRPVFQDERLSQRFPQIRWQTTAGNSSQISDGAAALLIVSERMATRLGLRPRARFVAFDVCGDSPLEMLTAPIPASRRALQKAELRVGDIDHFEINEAFASVPLAWREELGADMARLNPRGGAIALGHPLGASGARLMTTMLHALEDSGGRYGLQSMCEAGGMANATIIERL
ncbi:thiolase family protein [Cupriavidus respiraculi]|uniref:Steroid 3-ketoacyl-CoA thiolase n=1 Tax=Cupriavidus respiraculi TaxID=195930 RepID=A0ABM8WDJ2_9BURK|nr:thiolase family protein [Cupriavidus respiraculi]MBY4949770.1 thiolase family protein [Cupriavidus respiraculi]CAG9165346.1 Steroid 3-ketoacyl-CoA thiolase [Cupriavidus respiraculi]